MNFARNTSWLLLIVFGLGISDGIAHAQDPTKLPQYFATAAIAERRDARGIPAGDLKDVQERFQSYAKYQAEIISHPLVYKATQDPTVRTDAIGRPIPSIDVIFGDLQRFLIEPTPASKVTTDKGDYIREMGIALDAALKPVIETHPERIVRVNAMRLLASACKTGATAHYPTLTELISNANTPTEVKYYALQAAANLLAAYDVYDYKSRRHSNGWKNAQKSGEGDAELAQLVTAIEKCILEPKSLIVGLANAKEPTISSDQLEVLSFVRRQAIKALAQVRFVTIPGVDAKTRLFPAYTLSRVCVSDPELVPLPSPSECAEAAIGLCNMSHFVNGDPVKDYNINAAVEAIAAAMVTFAEPRAANPLDRSLHWRLYGARIGEAFKNWRPLFDFLYNPVRPNMFNAGSVPPKVDDMIQRVQIAILTPVDKVGVDGKPDLIGGQIQIEPLRTYLRQLREDKTRNPLLFINNPSTALSMGPKK
jgi:hypothetical protein